MSVPETGELVHGYEDGFAMLYEDGDFQLLEEGGGFIWLEEPIPTQVWVEKPATTGGWTEVT